MILAFLLVALIVVVAGFLWDLVVKLRAEYCGGVILLALEVRCWFQLFTIKEERFIDKQTLRLLLESRSRRSKGKNKKQFNTRGATLCKVSVAAELGVTEDYCENLLCAGAIQVLLETALASLPEKNVWIKPKPGIGVSRINLEGIAIVHIRQIIADAVANKANNLTGGAKNDAYH